MMNRCFIHYQYEKFSGSFGKANCPFKKCCTRPISEVVMAQMNVRGVEIPEFETEYDFEVEDGNETDEGDDMMSEETVTDA